MICQTQHPRQLVLALIEDLSERLGSEEAQLIKIESMSIDYKKIMEKYQGSQANIISNITGSNTNANNSSAMQNANQELAQVREIMQRNVEKVLARGERMDTLADRTAGLQRDSLQFR